jgi:hypothetical protein
MIHIYEVEGHGTYWEIWQETPGEAWQDSFCRVLENQNELDLYLDICRSNGLDFVLHTLEEYDEYHVALS